MRGVGRYILAALVLSIVACASGPKEYPTPTPDKVASDVFRQGLEELTHRNYDKAHDTLTKYIADNPSGELKIYADLYLKLLDELRTLSGMVEQRKAEVEKLERELAAARQEIKRNHERYQKEIEDLKRDLEYLKAIDMELQRRGRSIR